jgi:hypothetical protein
VDFEVRVDTLDVVEHREHVGRCLIDIEVVKGGVTADIVVAVNCARRQISRTDIGDQSLD